MNGVEIDTERNGAHARGRRNPVGVRDCFSSGPDADGRRG
jgi:hypothetical protein